ncbi:hypothetical protein LGH70_03610 [Hymenobacter sp. BT635]|uniref:Uncharacterized protein n=1 Tax=Hymenobacter nitidus TaxID=2880929 RepID=A0ABS8A8B9_9BACT|nr:hypothetical protein [Hymenobacter nitidus]MCB2376650.1 hypothetical protein [Hymenobacter nitidus]
MSFAPVLFAALCLLGSLLPSARAQVSSKPASPDCDTVRFTDSLTSESLSRSDFVLTKTRTGMDLVILNRERLAAIQKLRRPILQFCYRGRLIAAKGIPLVSSEVPAQAEAFYSLAKDHTVIFRNTRLHINLVDKMVRKKY